jgi:hypothetical protein
MRSAAYIRQQKTVIYWIDLYILLLELERIGLAAMNDPTGTTGRIEACSSDANKKDALSKLSTAVTRALKAYEAEKAGNLKEAFAQWDLLFNGKFPAYY